eukprot:scaffold158315_cov34-Tisochrysis_lutea.AAC.2
MNNHGPHDHIRRSASSPGSQTQASHRDREILRVGPLATSNKPIAIARRRVALPPRTKNRDAFVFVFICDPRNPL